MSDVEKKPSPDHHLYAGFMGQFTKRDDMPALPDPFVKPLAANGLASKPGLYTVGQLVRYAEQRVREEREACAALCEAEAAFVKSDHDGGSATASNCAIAIRQRSKP